MGVDEKERIIVPIYQNHNDKIKDLIGNGYAYGTLERFKISLKHLQELILFKCSVSKVG